MFELNENESKLITNITNDILKSADAKNISEIYMSSYCIKGGKLLNVVNLFIVVNEDFQKIDLYDIINDIEDREYNFSLSISVEPEMEKGSGITLFKK